MTDINELVDHDLQEASKLVHMPTDDDIITDWKRHDKFRFKRVLVPFITMLTGTFGHFLTTTYVPEIGRDIYEFDSWPGTEKLKVVISILKAIFFVITPFCSIFAFQSVHPRKKLQVVMTVIIISYLFLGLSFYTASVGLFYFSISVQSMGYGFFFQTVVLELIGWFPDFSFFITAVVVLSTTVSFFMYKGINNALNNMIGFTTIPLVHCILFITIAVPLHYFVQSPPAYLPLFIRSMISAASLPRSSTLPLPSSLGVSARIPRAMGKFHKWRRKMQARRGRRRGYGELVSEEDIDRHELMEMDVIEGFDLEDTNLDDLYGDGRYPHPTEFKPHQQQGKGKYVPSDEYVGDDDDSQIDHEKKNPPLHGAPHTEEVFIVIDRNAKSNPSSPSPVLGTQGSSTGRSNLSSDDILSQIAASGYHRKGDEDDIMDARGDVFTIEDDEFGEDPFAANNLNNVPSPSPHPVEDVEASSHPSQPSSAVPGAGGAIRHPSHPQHGPGQTYQPSVGSKSIASTMLRHMSSPTNPSPLDGSNGGGSPQQPRQHSFKTTTGYAITAVVSQLDQFLALPIKSLFYRRTTLLYLVSIPLALLFPLYVYYLLPSPILIHLQNRTSEDAVDVFNKIIAASLLLSVALLAAGQFMGHRFVIITSLLLQLIPSLLWTMLVVIGGGSDPDPNRGQVKYPMSPIHIFIGMMMIGAFSFCFALIPTILKYFHEENFRVLFPLTLVMLAACYVFSPVMGLARAPLDDAPYGSETGIVPNATAYNWISRIGSSFIVAAIVILYRLLPITNDHRILKVTN